ncbi:hypothetical protein [Pleionea sp. CnH1-48]|uniref:hypothetical protein n=1 Tax=Pleionea sp. CnH1-48 TaxID=2954494 RepID=UPI00209798F6|nr:hypothetical protein [Pleionea sp. CnH1-48]MCO7225839.1 hypothetical protein [Pleionea sp. CnH1-48]
MAAEIVTMIKDVSLSIAALTLAGVAIVGLKSWRKENNGKAEFEAAKSLIKAVYSLREELNYCRAPFVTVEELPSEFASHRNPSAKEEAEAWMHVFKQRWIPVYEAIKEFDACTLEAEALWGENISELTQALRKCVTEVNIAMDTFISDKASGGKDFTTDPELGKEITMKVMNQNAKQNVMTKRIYRCIENLEDYLQPFLNRR